MAKTPNKQMINRAIVVLIILFTACVILIGFLFYYQILKYDFYKGRATSQQTLDTTINANRGTITDRNGIELAVSTAVKTVYICPKNIETDEEATKIAKDLSEMLDVDYDTVYKKTQKNNYYEIIKRKIDSELVEKVRTYVDENDTDCIYLIDDTKRHYPFNNLASHIIGFVGTDNVGLDGVERTYNAYLEGTNGKLVTAKNNAGSELPIEKENYEPAIDGKDVVLTIDYNIQYFLEKYIEQARKDNKCMSGAAGMIMDVNTGEILAITSKPDYDLNNYQEITDTILAQEYEYFLQSSDVITEEQKEALEKEDSEDGDEDDSKKMTAAEKKTQLTNLMRRNKLIVDTYEPGSTFKILTAAMALEEDKVSVNDSFYCNGAKQVANYRIACWKHGGHGAQNFAQAMQNSCNPAFMTIAEKVQPAPFISYFRNFGLTEKTGIDVAGEATGIFHSEKNFNDVELATASFGQRFKVTPIQMITAVASVANGGYLVTPHVVKEIVATGENDEKTLVKSIGSGIKRQVVSEQTSKELCGLLEDVVSIGSGKNAYVKGYRVAGKTGTSEKLESESTTGEEEYIASFIGFAPADDPKIAILVMLDEPNGAEYFGGLTAAPVAGNILAEVLPYLEITPEYTQSELESLDTAVPSVIGFDSDDALKAIEDKGLDYKIIGGEGTVEYQMPKGGTSIPRTGTVVLYTNGKEPSKTVTVPDITKMGVAGASKMINNYGLNFRAVGNESTKYTALINSQTPAAGTLVEAGTVVTAYYKNYDDVSN